VIYLSYNEWWTASVAMNLVGLAGFTLFILGLIALLKSRVEK